MRSLLVENSRKLDKFLLCTENKFLIFFDVFSLIYILFDYILVNFSMKIVKPFCSKILGIPVTFFLYIFSCLRLKHYSLNLLIIWKLDIIFTSIVNFFRLFLMYSLWWLQNYIVLIIFPSICIESCLYSIYAWMRWLIYDLINHERWFYLLQIFFVSSLIRVSRLCV